MDAKAQDSDTPVRGSEAHRTALEERTRQRFAERVQRWTAAGKSEEFLAYMQDQLEMRIHDIRTKPPEWFTMRALRARIREKDEAAARVFLQGGYSRQQIEAVLGDDLKAPKQ